MTILINEHTANLTLAFNFIGAIKNEDYHTCDIIYNLFKERVQQNIIPEEEINSIINFFSNNKIPTDKQNIENLVNMLNTAIQP